MGKRYQVISADGHNEVPVDRWIHRVPEEHRHAMPQLVKHEDGADKWRIEIDGQRWERSASGNLVADWDYDEFVPDRPRYYREDGSRRPGSGDALQRLQEQDRDGVDAEILFPPVYSPIFFRNALKEVDVDAHKAFIRGYNDWLADEYCSVAPDRLIGVAMLPETGVDDAIAEMAHIKAKGLRSVAPAVWPNGSAFYEPDDDRFFAASLDLDVKLSPHGTFGGVRPIPPGSASLSRDTLAASGGGGPSYTIGQLIVYGVFDRFPTLQVYFAETQAGWLPHALNWTDEFYRRWNHYVGLELSRLPSEYYRDHCKFSFIVDRMAMTLRQYIGTDMLMFGTDFPHSVGTFPYTRDWIEDLFEGVPDDVRHQVLVENVCEFFGLDPNAEVSATPQVATAGAAQ
jgi:predicted TIM-barrel fold metal-dependent hydrolase